MLSHSSYFFHFILDFQEGEMFEYLVQPYSRKLKKDNFRDYDDILDEFTPLVKWFHFFSFAFAGDLTIVPTFVPAVGEITFLTYIKPYEK